MHPRLSRKKELARRTLVYSLMTFSMLTLLIILMMAVLGYQFDVATRSVERTGLVQYGSFPRSATVTVDGKGVAKTPSKSVVLPGSRQFAMNLHGFEPWQKTLDIQEGTVTWLSYVRLVPTEKVVESSLSFDQLDAARTSPDDRFMATWRVDASGPTVGLIDFRDSKAPISHDFALTAQQIGGLDPDNLATKHSFKVTGWSNNSRYFITRHEYGLGDGTSHAEWLWSDRESLGSTVNLDRLFGLSPADVRPMNSRDVFLLTGSDVRQASVTQGDISKPLVTAVNDFNVRDDDVITYTAQVADENVAGIWQRGSAEPMVIARLPQADASGLKILSSRYFNKDTVAVASGQQVTYYRGDLPTGEDGLAAFLRTADSFTFSRQVSQLQFSSNGRFLIAEDASNFISFDIERQSVSQNMRKYSESSLGWLDGYHIAQVDETGMMIMQEFDGLNANTLMNVTAGFDHLLTQDGRYIYGWYRDGESWQLRQLAMTAQS